MKRILSLILALSSSLAVANQSTTEHKTFFKGADYELNVYHIKGKKPGKTLLLIGGIQGDEPGGFLSADLYTDIELEQGNLIVVPRANFKSIILTDRGPDGDMNRQFHEEASNGPMTAVVKVLKNLMGEADTFLHLHDGWGYHHPTYINELRNPNRYGQSLIVDTENYNCSDGERLALGQKGRDILARVNQKISNVDHHLQFFDTKTSETETRHKAMRKTATYFALRKHCLPSFGVESSKNLATVELKILYHNLVINEFMADMNIIPTTPRILVPKTEIYLATVEVNGKKELLTKGETLNLNKGDRFKVIEIASNTPRGISCDLLKKGDLNDLGESFTINRDTKLLIRKEGKTIASFDILTNGRKSQAVQISTSNTNAKYRVFIVKVNGIKKLLLNDQTLTVNKGDLVKLISSFSDGSNTSSPLLNFKGWVPKGGGKNNGDDRGYDIRIKDSAFIKRYSKNGNGKRYPIVSENEVGKKVGKFWVRIR